MNFRFNKKNLASSTFGKCNGLISLISMNLKNIVTFIYADSDKEVKSSAVKLTWAVKVTCCFNRINISISYQLSTRVLHYNNQNMQMITNLR